MSVSAAPHRAQSRPSHSSWHSYYNMSYSGLGTDGPEGGLGPGPWEYQYHTAHSNPSNHSTPFPYGGGGTIPTYNSSSEGTYNPVPRGSAETRNLSAISQHRGETTSSNHSSLHSDISNTRPNPYTKAASAGHFQKDFSRTLTGETDSEWGYRGYGGNVPDRQAYAGWNGHHTTPNIQTADPYPHTGHEGTEFVARRPVWNTETNCYLHNFGSRVKRANNKNFVLISAWSGARSQEEVGWRLRVPRCQLRVSRR